MKKATVLSFAEAKQFILATIATMDRSHSRMVDLIDAANGYLAESIVSPINVPSFNNSAMDGYVIRQQDLEHSLPLPIAGSIFAGESNKINWPTNSCLRIMTGAAVPDDAYAVIMQEHVDIVDNTINFNRHAIKTGQNIRYIGENVKQGNEILSKGEKLTIAKLATLASLGIAKVKINQPIKVALLSTGNELTPLGQPLQNGNSIYDSNRFTLHLMLRTLGCDVIDLGIIKDDLTIIANTLQYAAKHADMIISSGGVSVGDADYTKQALDKIGEVSFWKIAIKPGKPFAFGHIGKALFCGLPGNPVSTLVTFYQLVRPLILSLNSQQQLSNPLTFNVKSNSNLKKSIGRMDFQRGYLYSNEQGELVVDSTGEQGSHITSSFNHANCFILLEKDRGNVKAGELVTVELFDNTLL